MLAVFGDAVELARGYIVAHAVDLVVVGPQLAGGRIEVKADRVTETDRIDFAVRAVVHPDDAADAGPLAASFSSGGTLNGWPI